MTIVLEDVITLILELELKSTPKPWVTYDEKTQSKNYPTRRGIGFDVRLCHKALWPKASSKKYTICYPPKSRDTLEWQNTAELIVKSRNHIRELCLTLRQAIYFIESVERRAGSASHQSAFTDAHEVAEWCRHWLALARETK